MSSVENEQKSFQLQAGDYSVAFVPSRGMNFISLKKGEIEIIDQSTRTIFDERYAGLGAFIGPHFHHRKVIPPLKNPSLFPHIATLKARGVEEPFSHGIGRYAPWTVEDFSEGHIHAVLRGSDTWNSIPLKELEGQDFTMNYLAKATQDGIEIILSVRSETESVVGLHTYYALSGGEGTVMARVVDHYNDQGALKPIPSTWNYQSGPPFANDFGIPPFPDLKPHPHESDHMLLFPMSEPCDYGFRPYPNPLEGAMELQTQTHGVRLHYWCDNEENSIQLWHPPGASFVCMEPLSAKDPRKPRLTVSQLKILISVLP